LITPTLFYKHHLRFTSLEYMAQANRVNIILRLAQPDFESFSQPSLKPDQCAGEDADNEVFICSQELNYYQAIITRIRSIIVYND